MKKILLLTILTTCLSACRTPPKYFIGTQCSPVYSYEDLAGVTYINAESSKCFCRQYRVSPEFIGPTSESKNYPIEKCNKIIGYSPKEYVELNNLMEYVRVNINTSDKKLYPEAKQP